MFFSIVVPVFNRPSEIQELLDSLTKQEYKNFEVVIVEDGSFISCNEVIESYREKLKLQYFFIENVGQGFARNFGMQHAQGDYFVLFDSDCVIPKSYLSDLKEALVRRNLDAHGGPDAASETFNNFQKAINFSMTSFLTTGGIRGKLKDPKKFEARGFNMGFSKEVFLKTKGFIHPNQAEDIELSIRIKKLGFQLELVTEAFVFHKRRTDWTSFTKQSFSFGRNRITVSQYHPNALKLVHFLPSCFLLFNLIFVLSLFTPFALKYIFLLIYLIWILGILTESYWQTSSFVIALLSLGTSWIQLNAYGWGFLKNFTLRFFR
jgi:glycosyltransferase involved in cell wall biosynthesis